MDYEKLPGTTRFVLSGPDGDLSSDVSEREHNLTVETLHGFLACGPTHDHYYQVIRDGNIIPPQTALGDLYLLGGRQPTTYIYHSNAPLRLMITANGNMEIRVMHPSCIVGEVVDNVNAYYGTPLIDKDAYEVRQGTSQFYPQQHLAEMDIVENCIVMDIVSV